MTGYAVDPAAVIALGDALGPLAARLDTANRHRTSDQASLVGEVGESYDRFRRSLYRDGLLNQQAIELLALKLRHHGADFDRVEKLAKRGSDVRGGGPI